MKCKICGKQAASRGYCSLHRKAHENVVSKYEVWQKALGISWKEYLREIVNNPLTGESAKETAEYISQTGEKQDGTKNEEGINVHIILNE